MSLKAVQISLDAEAVQTVLAIALDDDKDRALAFIKTQLAKRVGKDLQPH